MMKQKTDLKNKPANWELPDNDDIIDLVEEIDKSHDRQENKVLKYENAGFLNDDEEIIVLKEEVPVTLEEKEDIIELTDEVPIASPKGSTDRNICQKADMAQQKAGIKYVVIPIEAFEAASGKSSERVPHFFPRYMHQAAISIEIIDASIERVIHNIFADKIEFMLKDAVKKVVVEEINQLQNQILHQHEKEA